MCFEAQPSPPAFSAFFAWITILEGQIYSRWLVHFVVTILTRHFRLAPVSPQRFLYPEAGQLRLELSGTTLQLWAEWVKVDTFCSFLQCQGEKKTGGGGLRQQPESQINKNSSGGQMLCEKSIWFRLGGAVWCSEDDHSGAWHLKMALSIPNRPHTAAHQQMKKWKRMNTCGRDGGFECISEKAHHMHLSPSG